MSAAPRRINVVGNSASGKSTFSRLLTAKLGVPHIAFVQLRSRRGMRDYLDGLPEWHDLKKRDDTDT